jgi:hypothetical protein
MLRQKFQKAIKGVQETSDAYRELTLALDNGLVEKWKKDEEKATTERGDALDIYNIKLQQGIRLSC